MSAPAAAARRIAFYAPLKAPTHPVPSGDRRMARLLMDALAAGGHRVRLACTLRSWDDATRPGRAERLAALGARCAARLTARLRADPPDLWFTYHLYYKAPDWLGPAVCADLGIPYVVAEASHAARRATGPLAAGHAAAADAIRRADAVINLAGHDAAGVLPLLRSPDRLVRLRPFLDTAPFAAAAAARDAHRTALARRFALPADVPWLLAVGMMRGGDKRRSYAVLAAALARLGHRDWRLLVVGDGPERSAVERELTAAAGADRVRFAGVLEPGDLAAACAAADLMVWPAVNEAYGMALLEAQAAGLPVVAGRTGGVPDIVRDGRTGALVPVGDAAAFAAAVDALLADPGRRGTLAAAAGHTAAAEHGFAAAAAVLDGVVRRLTEPGSRR
ncbi:glycosyltransferase family 4 protein [Azospirillum halopraeferens]|uniref:glycosyltransferase family 4 protein n=1 Tax=Azospirillum halopraeferens TaxID=34010 RepID=UPI00041A744D|nr:glycosyltransferase family 4 protein [Azospirillum halopraeferens]